MKKVYHLLNVSGYSGAEHVVIDLINATPEYDHYYISPSGKIDEILNKLNINHIKINKLSYSEIKKILLDGKPDIVHAHDFRASFLAAAFTTFIHSYGGIVISHLHKNDLRMGRFSVLAATYLTLSFKFDRIVVVSKSVIDEYIFKKFVQKKVIVLGNIVDYERVVQLSNQLVVKGKIDIVYVARINKEKDPLKFINIISLIKKYIPDVRALWIGEGDMKRESEILINKLNLKSNIKMMGYLENPYPYINKAKVSVITSKYEGFGLGALESLTFGKPVVGTPVGGLTSFISIKNGLLSSSDKVLANEVVKLLTDNDYYREKSEAAILTSLELNDVENFAKKILQAYQIN